MLQNIIFLIETNIVVLIIFTAIISALISTLITCLVCGIKLILDGYNFRQALHIIFGRV